VSTRARLANRPPGSKGRLLHRVFGLSSVIQHGRRHAVAHCDVGFDQSLEADLIARPGSSEELLISTEYR
jgi:hypothetical protein